MRKYITEQTSDLFKDEYAPFNAKVDDLEDYLEGNMQNNILWNYIVHAIANSKPDIVEELYTGEFSSDFFADSIMGVITRYIKDDMHKILDEAIQELKEFPF